MLILLGLFPQPRVAAHFWKQPTQRIRTRRVGWLCIPGSGAGALRLMTSLLSVHDENELLSEQQL